ncbi:TonB-dependent receptor [Paucibacter sp. AS339]|uniref:TonB-dependent receptor n=1 Tax=Paucibacter hankyongi TaxID=3133434 RepID=UPI0030B5A81F
MLKQYKVSAIGAAAFLAVSALGSSASAQTAPQTQQIERVTVTGSNIKRVQSEEATVVQVITKQDIERSGATTANEVFLKLPGFSSYNDEANATGAPGRSTLGFRQFSADDVLVLVNGRRMAKNSANASAYDLSSIPLAAIERVEVLKDGASAIYGSDAIAGVVNFVTRRDFQGIEGNVTYGQSSRGDGEEKRFSGALGFGDFERDGFNLLVTLDHLKRDPILRRDRDITFRKGPGMYNDAAPTGNVISKSTGGATMPVNKCTEELVTDNAGTYCPYYFNKAINLIPATERTGVLGVLTKKIGAESSAYVEALVSTNKTTNFFSAPPGTFTNVKVPAGGITLANGTKLPEGEIAEKIRIRYDQNGVRRWMPKTDFSRIGAGFETRAMDTDFTFEIGTSESKTDYQATGFFDYATAKKDIAAGTFSPWVVPNAADIAKYNVSGTTISKGKVDFFNAKATRELFKLDGGMAAAAVGYSHNKESISYQPDELSAAGRLSATGAPVTAINGSRKLDAVYAELGLPILKTLEAQLAVRYDRYSDFGSVTTPKLAMKWTPVRSLAIRGSYSEGFRAPAFEDLLKDNEESAEFAKDYLVCADKGIDKANCVQTQYDVVRHNNPDLKPEHSKNFALGAVFEISRDLVVSADWYAINKTDAIGRSLQYILDNPDKMIGGKLGKDWVTRAAPGAGSKVGNLVGADLPILNVAKIEAQGLEFGLSYRLPTAVGRFALENQFSYNLHFRQARAPGEPLKDYVGLMDRPKFVNNVTVNWDFGPWMASVSDRYMDGFKDANEPEDVSATTKKVKGFNTVDLQLGYKGLGFKNSKLIFGVKNAFDTMPGQTDNDQNAGFPNSMSAVGRQYYLGYSFGY